MNERRMNRLSMKTLRRFAKGQHGLAAVEFALVLPLVLLLLLGCFEVPRFVLIYQRIARTAHSVSDLVAQADEPITTAQMQDIFKAGKVIMSPYDVIADGRIYVSSINNPGGAGVKLTWQTDNGGAVGTASKLGTPPTNPATPPPAPQNLPAAITPLSNEEVLVAEVYYNYKPIFTNLIYSGTQLYVVAYTRPRNKNLNTKPNPWPGPGTP
jgi:Flp pilus assembly protein TadG